MSTARAAMFVFLVGCSSSSKPGDLPAELCLPAQGSTYGVISNGQAIVCVESTCLTLDRDGKPTGRTTSTPPRPPPQVQQDRQVGKTRVVARDALGQWTLKNPETGDAVPVGKPNDRLDIIEPASVIAYAPGRLQLADATTVKVIARVTVQGSVATLLPWFDRVFVVLERPTGTLQIDPATATVYTGAPLPVCR